MSSGNGNNTMILVVVAIGGVCCLLSIGLGLFFYFNESARDWLTGLFDKDGESSSASDLSSETVVDTGSAGEDGGGDGTASTPEGSTPSQGPAPAPAQQGTSAVEKVGNKYYVCPRPSIYPHWKKTSSKIEGKDWPVSCCTDANHKDCAVAYSFTKKDGAQKIRDNLEWNKNSLWVDWKNNPRTNGVLYQGKCPCATADDNKKNNYINFRVTKNNALVNRCHARQEGTLKYECQAGKDGKWTVLKKY